MTASDPSFDQPVVSNDGLVLSFEQGDDSKALILTVRSLTSKFLEPELIKLHHKSLEGKEIRWRHVQPELFSGSFLGETLETWVDEKSGDLMSKIRLDGDTKEQKKAQEWVLERMNKKDGKENKVGISVGFIRIMDDDDETTKVFFREQSITPFPHCDNCGVVNIVTNEDPNNTEQTPSMPASESEAGPMITLPSDFKGRVELETEDKGDKEDKDEDKKDKDAKKDEEEDDDKEDDEKKDGAKNEEKEKAKLKKVEQLESKNSELESRIKTYEKKMITLNDRNIELEVEKEIMVSAPKRRRIAELEGLKEASEVDKRMNELLQLEDRPNGNQPSQLDILLTSLERVAKAARAQNRTYERSSSGAIVTPRGGTGQGGQITSTQLETMSPDDILKSAGFKDR